MSNNKRNSDGQFASKGVSGPVRDNPWTSAAIAAGAAGIGAFLWSKRSRIGEAIDSGIEKLDEIKSERFGSSSDSDSRSQSEIAEEALTLKETGATSDSGFGGSTGSSGSFAGQSNQESKAGAKAYS